MANIILPAVPVLNEIDNNTKLLIEQAGEINRYPISNLDVNIDIDTSLSMTSENPVQNKVIAKAIADAGSIDIDLDGSNEGEANLINADTLGGYSADEYMRKSQSDIRMNYSVVGSITEPTNPAENMIWVNTDVEISKYKLSRNEPKNPIEEFVWISLGDNSNNSFHTLSIGEIEFDEVYPISAKQYIGGAWVDVTAKSYQNGEWVEWFDSSKLYYYNKQMYKWIVTTEKMNSGSGTITPTVVYNSDGSVTLTINPGGSTKSCMFRLEDLFDLTDYSLLTIETGNGINDTVQALVVYEDGDYWGEPGSDYNGEALAYKALSPNKTYTIPVSSINKSCRIGVGLYSASKLTVTLKSLTIE